MYYPKIPLLCFIGGLEDFFNFIICFWWIILTILVALMIMLIARLEKRWISDFKPCDKKDLPKPSAYTKAMNDMAIRQGFKCRGWFRQYRSKLCRGIATMWISEDALTLLVVGGGRIAGIKFKATFLYSKPSDAPVLITSDEPGERDLSGMTDKQFLLNADLTELYDLHKQRMGGWEGLLEPFDGSSPLREYESIYRRSVQAFVDYGLAKYLDFAQNEWRYTLKGAVLSYFQGWRTSYQEAKNQKERLTSIKRPGDNKET